VVADLGGLLRLLSNPAIMGDWADERVLWRTSRMLPHDREDFCYREAFSLV
jgi:hypothetical protein